MRQPRLRWSSSRARSARRSSSGRRSPARLRGGRSLRRSGKARSGRVPRRRPRPGSARPASGKQRVQRSPERGHHAHVFRPIAEAILDRDFADAHLVEARGAEPANRSPPLSRARTGPAPRASAVPAAPARSAPARTPSPTGSALPEPTSRRRDDPRRGGRGGSHVAHDRDPAQACSRSARRRASTLESGRSICLQVHDPMLCIRDSAASRGFDHHRREVGRDHPPHPARNGLGDVARPGGKVEHDVRRTAGRARREARRSPAR